MKKEIINSVESGRIAGIVSVIMPVYNAREFVSETIRSILDQTYSRWELLIVDDCSSDGTVAFIKDEFSEI